MSLTLYITHHFDCTVRCHLPGEKKMHEFQARFLEISQGKMQKILQDQERGSRTLLEKVLVGWKDIIDEQGRPILFSNDDRSRLLERPYLVLVLVKTYMRAMFASEDVPGEIQEKNCLPSLNIG